MTQSHQYTPAKIPQHPSSKIQNSESWFPQTLIPEEATT